MLLRRDGVEHQHALHGRHRRLLLLGAEFVPVDGRLPRIHALVHQPPGEFLDATVHFPRHHALGDLAGHAAGQLLEQLLPHPPRPLPFSILLQILADAPPQIGQGAEFAQILREFVVQGRQHPAAQGGDVDGVLHPRPRHLRALHSQTGR